MLTIMKQKITVKGMHCAQCVNIVNDSIKKCDGVNSSEVSLLTNSAYIDYDENVININKVIDNINKVGYEASIYKKISKQDLLQLKENRNKLIKLIISIVSLIILMFFSMGNMILMHLGFNPLIENGVLLIALQIVFLIPIVVCNFNYFISGFKGLIRLKPNMDALVALGSTISIIYGIYAFIMVILGDMEFSERIYLESAGTILTFVSLGKFFEGKATSRTSKVITDLVNLIPDFVTIKTNNKEKNIPIEEVKIGDNVIIKPGETIPLDGIILEGYGNINESMITGESMPIFKDKGKTLISGTINTDGSIIYKVSKAYEDSTVNQIIKLIEEASVSKVPLGRIADKIASFFVPLVIAIALFTFAGWMLITNFDYNISLNYAISVLVISCPCALGLATPVAIMVGAGVGAKYGILIKSGEAFEKLNKVNTIILDKTGTLTKGEMKVEEIYGNLDELNKIIAIEKLSSHPLSVAIANYKEINESYDISNFNIIPGKGIEADIYKDHYLLGNSSLIKLNKEFKGKYDEYLNKGYTTIIVAKNDKIINLIAISDTLREESKSLIASLQEMGINVVLASGDNKLVATNVANALNIKDFYYEVKPNDKLKIVDLYKNRGNIVAMVGDGINDAPSLKEADIGIAIGCGTDVAIDSADIILMNSNLNDLKTSILLSKRVVKNIKLNLFWAFIYNVIMIPLAAGCLVALNITLNPMIASIAMSLSSICVVLNALRLNLFKGGNKKCLD